MDISELYKIFLHNPTITTDSRKIPQKCIFWALKGERFDGNKFIKTALDSGACFAITDDKKEFISEKTILVEDSLKTLQLLANYHRKQLKLPVFALTGTNGKTTTKELIYAVLSTQYNVKATQGNFNNHIGVPLTILSFNKETEIGIIEMGANHLGEIQQLCNIAEPNFGLITNIGKAHLEGFGSFENIIKTKFELYQHLKKNKGSIFYNSDNSILLNSDKGDKIISYGTKTNVYLKGEFISANPFVNFEIETFEGLKTEINSHLAGSYNFENLTAAACVGDFFKISIQNIKKAVETYIPSNNRSQLIKKQYNTIILDAYNANPTSMTLAITNFLNYLADNKAIILGDMYELGHYSKNEHQKIISLLKKALDQSENLKEVIITGKYFKEAFSDNSISPNIKHFNTTEEVETFLRNHSYTDYTFLIKGSRAMHLENLIKYIN